MEKYIVLEAVTLTVEPGSQVLISESQYGLAKKSLKKADVSGAELHSMSKPELMSLAEASGIAVPANSAKAEIIELLMTGGTNA